jgi:predicted nucleotide-binding protein
MIRPSVFIGSSSEGLEVARSVREQLKPDVEITIWHEGVFGLGQGTLEALVNAITRFDFAVLVLTPDDLVESRHHASQSPRDNVLFECGLFMGKLGRERTLSCSTRISS